MANFINSVLTNEGRKVLVSALASEKPLRFTRMTLGDGQVVNEITSMKSLNDLINPRLDSENLTVEVIGDGSCSVRGSFSNKNLTSVLLINEVGVFAEDPNDPTKEMLYCYTTANGDVDFMGQLTSTVIFHDISILTYVDSADNIIANVIQATKANQIGFDGSKAGLNADNVQDALIEIAKTYPVEIPILHNLNYYPDALVLDLGDGGYGNKGYGESLYGGNAIRKLYSEVSYESRDCIRLSVKKELLGTPKLVRINDLEYIINFDNVSLYIVLLINAKVESTLNNQSNITRAYQIDYRNSQHPEIYTVEEGLNAALESSSIERK